MNQKVKTLCMVALVSLSVLTTPLAMAKGGKGGKGGKSKKVNLFKEDHKKPKYVKVTPAVTNNNDVAYKKDKKKDKKNKKGQCDRLDNMFNPVERASFLKKYPECDANFTQRGRD